MTAVTCALATELYAWRAFQSGWSAYQTGLRLLDRRHDLEGLVRWARRKRLRGPHAHYRRLLMDTELDLLRLQLRFARASAWAHVAYACSRFVFNQTPKYRQGHAQKYHLRKESLRNK